MFVYNLHPPSRFTIQVTTRTHTLPLLAPPFNKRGMAFYVHWSPFDRERERRGRGGRGVRPSIIISRLTNPEGRGGMTTIIIQYWGKGRMEEKGGNREGRKERKKKELTPRPYITWEFCWALSTKEEINLLCMPPPSRLSATACHLCSAALSHCCGRQLNLLVCAFPIIWLLHTTC